MAPPRSAQATQPNPLAPIRNLLSNLRTTLHTSRSDLTYGTSARLLSVLLLYPLDFTKARLQAATTPRLPLSSLKCQNLYAGLPAAVLGQLPYSAITFSAFTILRSKLAEERPSWSPRSVTIASAVLADFIGSIWLAPFEAVKLRVQTGMAASLPASLRVGRLYQGWVGQFMRDVPHRALQIVAYERLRKRFEDRVGRDVKPVEGGLIGCGAGMGVAAVTTPLDVIRTRVMAQRPGHGAVYGNWPSTLVKTVSSEGLFGLFRGFVPRVVYMGASVAIFSVGFEISRAALKDFVARNPNRPFARPVAVRSPTSNLQVFVDAPSVE